MQRHHRRGSPAVTEHQPPPSASGTDARMADNDRQRLLDALRQVANQRDRTALARLAGYFAPRLLAFACQKTLDEQLAREIVQDTLLAIWHKAASFDQDKGSLTTWVYTIARNLCFDAGRRKLARITLVSADALYGQSQPPVDCRRRSGQPGARPPQDPAAALCAAAGPAPGGGPGLPRRIVPPGGRHPPRLADRHRQEPAATGIGEVGENRRQEGFRL